VQASRLAGEHAMDAEQSDVSASSGGVRSRVSLRARFLGEPHSSGVDRGRDRSGCPGRAPCPQEKNGYAGGRATGHSRRPHDRKRVLHLFCRGGDGVALVAGFVFRAWRGDGFLARTGHESGAFRLGRERDATDMAGASDRSFALEPGIVCSHEVPLLLLLGVGIGANARAGRVGRRIGCGCPHHDSRWRACADLDDGGVLPVAWAAGAGGRVEILCRKRGTSARIKERDAGGGVKKRKSFEGRAEVSEAKEREGNIAAFFDLDGTLMALPSLELRFFRTLRYQRTIRAKNYFFWLKEALRLLPCGIDAILQANKMYLHGVQILDGRGEGEGCGSS